MGTRPGRWRRADSLLQWCGQEVQHHASNKNGAVVAMTETAKQALETNADSTLRSAKESHLLVSLRACADREDGDVYFHLESPRRTLDHDRNVWKSEPYFVEGWGDG